MWQMPLRIKTSKKGGQVSKFFENAWQNYLEIQNFASSVKNYQLGLCRPIDFFRILDLMNRKFIISIECVQT